jgi:ribonuclease BN (tRNA processing enzyme)
MTDNVEITFLGTCAGTEPMPGRHHSSFVIKNQERLYWFDAGECCAHTAHLAGIDLPSTEAIFVSHAHIDHVGGLPHLLWTLSKLSKRSPDAFHSLEGRVIDVFIPDLGVWESILNLLSGTGGGFPTPFKLQGNRYDDGVIYDANGLRVIALHNGHLGYTAPHMSFSFRAEIGQKRIVYSGDVRSIEDCEPLLDDCDLLLMETGHHKVEDICHWLKNSQKRISQLIFVHNGRAILDDSERELRKAKAILGEKVSIAYDGMVVQL